VERNETALCRNAKHKCCCFAINKKVTVAVKGIGFKENRKSSEPMEVCTETLNKCYIFSLYVKILYFCHINEGSFS